MFFFERLAVITALVLVAVDVGHFNSVIVGWLLIACAIGLLAVSGYQYYDLRTKKQRLSMFLSTGNDLSMSLYDRDDFIVFDLEKRLLEWANPVHDFLKQKMIQYAPMFYRGFDRIARDQKRREWDTQQREGDAMIYHDDKIKRQMRDRYDELLTQKLDYLAELAGKLGL